MMTVDRSYKVMCGATDRLATDDDCPYDEPDRISIRRKPMPNPSIITITDLGFAYPDSPYDIFEHLPATQDRGCTALLDDNG